jgi:hypothetical protein
VGCGGKKMAAVVVKLSGLCFISEMIERHSLVCCSGVARPEYEGRSYCAHVATAARCIAADAVSRHAGLFAVGPATVWHILHFELAAVRHGWQNPSLRPISMADGSRSPEGPQCYLTAEALRPHSLQHSYAHIIQYFIDCIHSKVPFRGTSTCCCTP